MRELPSAVDKQSAVVRLSQASDDARHGVPASGALGTSVKQGSADRIARQSRKGQSQTAQAEAVFCPGNDMSSADPAKGPQRVGQAAKSDAPSMTSTDAADLLGDMTRSMRVTGKASSAVKGAGINAHAVGRLRRDATAPESCR